MKIACIIILFPFLLSCKKADAAIATSDVLNSQPDAAQTRLTDSLFIGEPLVKEAEFIRNTESLGNNFQYFELFEALLKKHNKKYVNHKSNGFIKAFKVSDLLTLELKRKKYSSKNKTKDIQVVLYTKINNILKDSILFYKYQLDKDFPTEQRFEALSFLDNNLELFKMESYSSLSELAFQAERWEKYKINSSNGKIELIEKLNYKENPIQQNDEEIATMSPPIAVEDVANDEFPFISNLSWSTNCTANNYAVFTVAGGQFKFSGQFAINTTVKKVAGEDYEVYYRHPVIRPIPESMLDCGDYSTEIPIAKMKFVNDKIEFFWHGFYNVKAQKKTISKNPFTQKTETGPVILEKCSS